MSAAVFLSYASEDAAAAERIATSLRDAGIEVWFDKSELVGGDAWDAKIRRQIQECTLFLPIISSSTQARTEGYFRLEWRLADQRTHLMAKGRPFLVPIVIDDTHDSEAHVPDAFFDVQWSRFPEGEINDDFADRVKELLKGEVARPAQRRSAASVNPAATSPPAKSDSRWWLWLAVPAFAYGLWVAFSPMVRQEADPKSGQVESASTSASQDLVDRARSIIATQDDTVRETSVMASELLQQAQELDPLNAEAWASHAQLTGRMLDREQIDFEEGFALLRRQADRAMQLDPDSLESQIAHGWRLLWNRQTLQEARRHVTQLLDTHPQDGRPMLLLGILEFRDRNNEESMAWFDRAAQFPDLTVRAMVDKALRQSIIGDFEGLEESVERSLAIRPTATALLLKVRNQTLWLGDLKGALATLEEMPPASLLEDRGAFNVFRVNWWMGNTERAFSAARSISGEILQDIQFPGPRSVLLATAHEASGMSDIARLEWDRALETLTPLWEADPLDVDHNYLRSLCLVRLGRNEEALQAINTALRLRYNHRTMWPGGGFVGLLHDLGETDRALVLLDEQLESGIPLFASRAVLSLNPDLADFRGNPRFMERVARAPGPVDPDAVSRITDPVSRISQNSIAVLAFENRSADADNEYFSDGISEELLNVLTRVEGLKVTSRTSAFHFKGKDTPIPEIGRQLSVAHVVEGSVRRSGDRVRISVQLIKAEDGFTVWSESFDRELKDIFAVQDEIAGLVAEELQLKLGVTSPQREVNPEAYALFLEARHLWNQRGFDNFDRAEIALNRALELDPDFPEAHATLAEVWIMRATYRSYEGKVDVSEEIELTREFADHAISLNPDLSRPYSALGWAAMLEGKWDEARRWHVQAVERNPKDAMTRFWYSTLLAETADYAQAEQEIILAAELDPLSFIIAANRGFYSQVRRDWQASYDAYQRATQLRDGGFIPSLSAMAHAAFEMGRTDEAIDLSRQVLTSWPEGPRFTGDQFAVWVLCQTGHEAEAEAYVERILPELPPNSFLQGFLLAAIGRWEEALPNFENTPPSARNWVFENPILDQWRDDPRLLAMFDRWGETERYQKMRTRIAEMRK